MVAVGILWTTICFTCGTKYRTGWLGWLLLPSSHHGHFDPSNDNSYNHLNHHMTILNILTTLNTLLLTSLTNLITTRLISILSKPIKSGTSSRHSSRSAFGWSTGNDVSGHYKRRYFLFSFFPSSTFLIEGEFGTKNLFSKRWRQC